MQTLRKQIVCSCVCRTRASLTFTVHSVPICKQKQMYGTKYSNLCTPDNCTVHTDTQTLTRTFQYPIRRSVNSQNKQTNKKIEWQSLITMCNKNNFKNKYKSKANNCTDIKRERARAHKLRVSRLPHGYFSFQQFRKSIQHRETCCVTAFCIAAFFYVWFICFVAQNDEFFVFSSFKWTMTHAYGDHFFVPSQEGER